jgi:hypothetical protein
VDDRPPNVIKIMENQTPFELNLAIRRWSENLAQSSAFRSENLNELESHLRDSVVKLESGGLSAEEAFLIASRRIGGGQQLAAEFGKLNGKIVWMDRLLWMLVGVQAWIFANGPLPTFASQLAALGWTKTNYHWQQGIALPVVVFILVRLVSLGASFWFVWWLIFKKGSKFGQWLLPKLQRRYSAVGYAIPASLLLLSLQALSGVPQYLMWRFNPATIVGETNTYLSYSHVIVHFTLNLGLVIFTLSLARKRLVSRSA